MFIRAGSQLHHVQVDGPVHGDVVVFVNSLGTDLRIWDDVVAPLTAAFGVVRYDMRGHGLTPPSEPPYSIDDLAGDLERLIDVFHVPRVTICGISVGGQVALRVAQHRRHQVERLILCDTGYRIGAADLWAQRIAAVSNGGLAAISDAVVSRWLTERYRTERPDDAAGYRYMVERCTVDGYTGVCAALRDADLEAVARDIRCPTLVLCGDQDQATPPALNTALAEAIPGAVFRSIPGAGHLPCIEQPEILSAHVAAFAGSHAHV
jgi:3-oxoadipate enol-lactonase